MLSVLWKQQPSKALLSILKQLDKPCGNLNLLLEKMAPSVPNAPWLEQTHTAHCAFLLLLHTGRDWVQDLCWEMLGITGAIPSDPFLWHNLDINHPVCSLKTRYSGQSLPWPCLHSLKEFLDPWGQTVCASQPSMLQSGAAALFIPANQRHLLGYIS